jgi:hypothetical protein
MAVKVSKTKTEGRGTGNGRGIGLGKVGGRRNEMAHPEFPDKTLDKTV